MTRPQAPIPYEGILQLRPATEAILQFLEKEMDTNAQFTVVFQEMHKNTSMDLYVAKQRSLVAVAKKLNERFPGTLTLSRKLHTRNRTTGKLVYRVTALFKPLDIRVGDHVSYKDTTYVVAALEKNSLTIKDLSSGKKYRVKHNSVHKVL